MTIASLVFRVIVAVALVALSATSSLAADAAGTAEPPSHGGGLEDSAKLLRQGRLSDALTEAERYLADHPREARARFLKGVILTEQKKGDEAIDVFAALIEDYPELPEPYNNLAVLYASHGEYDNARNALEQAIENHPDYAIAYENLGDVQAKLAARAYARAFELNGKSRALESKLDAVRHLLPEPASGPEPGTDTTVTKGKP